MKSKAIVLFALAAAQSAFAQLYYSCDRFGNYATNGHTVYNNVWGSNYGTQCLTVNAYNNWFVDANHSNPSGIKSYPNVEKKVSYYVDSMPAITSTFASSSPTSGSFSTDYDIWYDNYGYELMLWMNHRGAVGPISYNYDANGAVPEATNVTVGGHTWNIYRGSNGSNVVFSFLRTSNTNSGTVDITAISKWIRNRGWFGNANLHSIQFGFEITSTSGQQRFSVTNFGVSVGSTGGGTSGYYKLQNAATGLCVDGMGRTTNGSACGQYASGTSTNQQWSIVASGSSVKLQNRATGLYIDGMGRTTNGSAAGQYSSSSSTNQSWVQEAAGSNYKYRNAATGLYLDGMGRTANGSDLGQWASSSSTNQQFSRQAQ
jgi:hypothetical protein